MFLWKQKIKHNYLSVRDWLSEWWFIDIMEYNVNIRMELQISVYCNGNNICGTLKEQNQQVLKVYVV